MDRDRAVNDRMTDLPVDLLAHMVSMITDAPASEISDVLVIFQRKGNRTGILSGIPAELIPGYLIDTLGSYGMGIALDRAVDSVEIPDDLSDLS